MVYGRLYRRFEPQYYWWELVYLARRICLVSFRVLMTDRRAEIYIQRTMQGWQGLCFLVGPRRSCEKHVIARRLSQDTRFQNACR